MKKNNLILICGGKSVEHEISIISCQNIFKNINQQKYNIKIICIDKNGRWGLLKNNSLIFQIKSVKNIANDRFIQVVLINGAQRYIEIDTGKISKKIDIVFPIVHGSQGEDGQIQSVLELCDIPYVGTGVLSSAICMDKIIAKKILENENIKTVQYIEINKNSKIPTYNMIKKEIGSDFFVKPSSVGSSIGISKVTNNKQFLKAIKYAFLFSNNILTERAINNAKELECAVLGNDKIKISSIGEIIVNGHEFYDYNAKYIDKIGAYLKIPAAISNSLSAKIKKIALHTYLTLRCQGMARIDFLVDRNNQIYVNEVNTIPGFTTISMYPKLFCYDGIQYSELIDMLISLALDNQKIRNI